MCVCVCFVFLFSCWFMQNVKEKWKIKMRFEDAAKTNHTTGMTALVIAERDVCIGKVGTK